MPRIGRAWLLLRSCANVVFLTALTPRKSHVLDYKRRLAVTMRYFQRLNMCFPLPCAHFKCKCYEEMILLLTKTSSLKQNKKVLFPFVVIFLWFLSMMRMTSVTMNIYQKIAATNSCPEGILLWFYGCFPVWTRKDTHISGQVLPEISWFCAVVCL